MYQGGERKKKKNNLLARSLMLDLGTVERKGGGYSTMVLKSCISSWPIKLLKSGGKM